MEMPNSDCVPPFKAPENNNKMDGGEYYQNPDPACSPNHPPSPENKYDRRAFFETAARAAAAYALGACGISNQSPKPWRELPDLDRIEYLKLIPADKRLGTDPLKRLTRVTLPQYVSGDALDHIGMPVGGICAGQLYLSGDGRLWLWDIMNQHQTGVCNNGMDGANYRNPLKAKSIVRQGFAIRTTDANGNVQTRTLDRSGFPSVKFRGQYPIGNVHYEIDGGDFPVETRLAAWSPFIPLDLNRSSFPATIMEFHLRNITTKTVEVELAGWLENAVGHYSSRERRLRLENRVMADASRKCIQMSATPETAPADAERPRILYDAFDGGKYTGWKIEGTAFGNAPATGNQGADQHTSGFEGRGFVNTYQSSDEPKGRISRAIRIERKFINFLIGGGEHPGETCIQLMDGAKVLRTSTGRNSDALDWRAWNVAEFEGRDLAVEIVDNNSSGWGHIDIDSIEQADAPRLSRSAPPPGEEGDFGTMAIAALEPVLQKATFTTITNLQDAAPESVFGPVAGSTGAPIECVVGPLSEPPQGRPMSCIRSAVSLEPGEKYTIVFVISWHFPNLSIPGFERPVGRYYSNNYKDAADVAAAIVKDFDSLSADTKLWVDTWYNSSLPQWLLERTFANISTLATSTAYRFRDGRFWAWEGVGCCPGTCTHVWHYAWGVGRIFPEIERLLRERIEFGEFYDSKTGIVAMRGEFDRGPAIDGQAGAILRFYRDHQMSPDATLLMRNWLRVKGAAEYLIRHDNDGDGILDGDQPNTLDAAWFGKIAWISALSLAALRATAQMAVEVGDLEFASRCEGIIETGSRNITNELFNGEYFIQKPDPQHLDAIGADTGCYIDQVFGDSWARHTGLRRILPERETRLALQSLWKYNYAPDVGPFRAKFTEGRSYALAGDAGLIMCTWPKGGKRKDWKNHWQYMYFNECMTGFEHQVAAHMIWEGMLTEGLAVERAIHDRYNAKLRNPYNEIECGDHYARAMASYGVFTAICGFEIHGPREHIGFAPAYLVNSFEPEYPDHDRTKPPYPFRSKTSEMDIIYVAFTGPEGWGSFSQGVTDEYQENSIIVKLGQLRVRTVFVKLTRKSVNGVRCTATLDRTELRPSARPERDGVLVEFSESIRIIKGKTLTIRFE